jgi:type IV secretory pathway VirB4 component
LSKKKPVLKKVYVDDHGVFGEDAPTFHDLMTVADGIEVKSTEIYVSPSGFTKIYYVTGLPSTVHFGYLNRFFHIGADVHVTIHVEPADSTIAISKRTKLMTRIEAEILTEQKAGTNKAIAINQQQYQLLERERDELRLGIERLFYATIIFAVSSPDREEFLSACERIEREGFEGFNIRAAYKEHDLGFRSVAPIGENVLRHPIEMTSSALANAFPFTNSRFSHEFGVPLGIDWSSGHLNRYDAWHDNLPNANMIIIGTSGGGKSFLLKGIVARSAAFGIRHVIVDYEGEYGGVVQRLGGISIRIDERSPYKFNPFELEAEEERLADGSVRSIVDIPEKISQMERLIVSMAQLHAHQDALDAYTTASINSLLQELYEKDFGFTTDPESLYEQRGMQRDVRGDRLVLRVKRQQPRFSDFFDKLNNLAQTDERLAELVMRLRRFKEGGTEGMFDCYSNVELNDTPIVHFDLSSLSEKSLARKLGMQVVLEWTIERFVKKNVNLKKRVVIDEAQKMLESVDHAQFLEDVFRRIRKRSGSAVAASQDFRKFADSEYGRAIVNNSATKVLLRQDKNDKAAVMDVFGLEEREFDDLVGYRNGQGRWRVDNEVFYNVLTTFADEYDLFTTRFVQSEHQLALLQGGVNY